MLRSSTNSTLLLPDLLVRYLNCSLMADVASNENAISNSMSTQGGGGGKPAAGTFPKLYVPLPTTFLRDPLFARMPTVV